MISDKNPKKAQKKQWHKCVVTVLAKTEIKELISAYATSGGDNDSGGGVPGGAGTRSWPIGGGFIKK